MYLFLLIVMCSCENENTKKERLHKEKVLSSKYYKNSFLNYTTLKLKSSSVKKGLVSKSEYIETYNQSAGLVLGFSKNIDTIINRMNRNSSLYTKYIVSDSFLHYSRDSVETEKYKKEKDSILKLLK